ncbi:DUF305 domain-containing protein [Rubellimicrobium aerolatum]|uniref:DUF305 domain-containing protein n=1 Tax=Rubellimicrobium aerolatum TaxID=490979 RepID=A0ABW0SCD4_9RHOB|nr:DUF305 domain-containing protein [Rubellimicrobium aerolatum]MBP1806222.1 uncharacterized protein (DUF305 family) [Rubellimicrobium aerolatum]
MTRFTLTLALILAGGAALAQDDAAGQASEDAAEAGATEMMDGHGHDMGAMGDDMAGMDHGMMMDETAMSGLMAPMVAMMHGMPMESTGDVDADFLMMMIPHHQSAVEMARIALEQGDDEATRAMAQRVIDAQEAEIAEMRAMLETMGHAAPAE